MNKLLRINWVLFCIIIFVISRMIIIYQYNTTTIQTESNFFDTMCKWDCEWYLTIVNEGYDLAARTTPKLWIGMANWAFFPLYPILVKIFSLITQVRPMVVGIILNQCFVLTALFVFYRYLKLFVNELNSRFGVILFAFAPFSVYCISLYAEALFLLLSVLSFYCMRTHRFYLAALCGSLLSATRPVGVFFSLALFIFYIRNKGLSKYNLINAFLLSFLASLGIIFYMIYLQLHMGDFLAFKHIQLAWGRSGLTIDRFADQIIGMINSHYNFRIFIASVLISGLLVIKRYYEEAIFSFLCILPGFLTGTMISEGRFCLTLFTFYFGIVILSSRSYLLKLILVIISVPIYILFFNYWLEKMWFIM